MDDWYEFENSSLQISQAIPKRPSNIPDKTTGHGGCQRQKRRGDKFAKLPQEIRKKDPHIQWDLYTLGILH